MKFLANENFPVPSIHKLTKAGYDVHAVILTTPGISDEDVLSLARKEGRIILTFDKDYGQLIFKKNLPPPSGMIFFRYNPPSPEEPAEHLLRIFTRKELTFEGKFTVISEDRIRQRVTRA
jgi:predicted nuclease of predicted toxin-antitoxin system